MCPPPYGQRPLVGIVTLDNQVVQDDIDRAYGFTVVTPALIREAVAISPGRRCLRRIRDPARPRSRDVPAVEQEIVRVVPAHMTYEFHVTSRVVSDVELAIKPESVALGAFGVDRRPRGAGAGRAGRSPASFALVTKTAGYCEPWEPAPVAAAGDGLIGILAAVILGSLLAVAVAVALSPLSPLGPVRPVYPDPGIAFDWTVLGAGLAC